MRPLTSGRTVTPWRDFKLPTACVSSVSFITSTLADSTEAGRAGAPAPLAAAPVGFEPDADGVVVALVWAAFEIGKEVAGALF
jgi:hypothetical protein